MPRSKQRVVRFSAIKSTGSNDDADRMIAEALRLTFGDGALAAAEAMIASAPDEAKEVWDQIASTLRSD